MTKRATDVEDDTSIPKKPKPTGPSVAADYRFLITNKIAGVVIGKGGAKVGSIRTEADVMIRILSIDKFTTAGQERVMVIKGTPDSVAFAIALITQHILDTNAGQANTVPTDVQLLVHSAQTGAIIGKGGATIKDIMSTTGSVIRISKELTNSTEKNCTITGDVSQVQNAVLQVLAKLEEAPLRQGQRSQPYLSAGGPAPTYGAAPAQPANPYGATPQYGAAQQSPYGAYTPYPDANQNPYMAQMQQAPVPSPQGGSLTAEVQIPSAVAGSVIGKRGAVIQDINARSGCNVSIRDGEDDTNTRTVSIKGSAAGIPVALGMIRMVAEPTCESNVTELLPIPTSSAGVLIGKAGCVVQELRNVSGVSTITISDPLPDEPTQRNVSVSGGPVAVQCCLALMRLKLSEGGNQARAQPQYVQVTTHTQQCSIPARCSGAIIGKGGATISEIKAQTQCIIQIADALPENPEERVVTVTGSAEGTQSALIIIQQKVQACSM